MSVSFPAVITVTGSEGHEVVLLRSNIQFVDLQKTVVDLVTASGNCEAFMKSMAKDDSKQKLIAHKLAVKWANASDGNANPLFPKSTYLSASNCQAVLRLVELSNGRDVIEATIGPTEAKEKDVNKEAAGSGAA